MCLKLGLSIELHYRTPSETTFERGLPRNDLGAAVASVFDKEKNPPILTFIELDCHSNVNECSWT